jgi:hypothetical protein
MSGRPLPRDSQGALNGRTRGRTSRCNADIMWRNTSTQDLLTWRMNGTTIAGSFTPLTASNPTLISNGTFSDQN